MMKNNGAKMIIITVILLLFLPLVAVTCRIMDSSRALVCHRASSQTLMQGGDEPGKLRIYLVPGDTVDINTADSRQLELLPMIGPALAGRIMEYREVNGGFADVRQLLEIEGVDEKLVESIAHMIYAGENYEDSGS